MGHVLNGIKTVQSQHTHFSPASMIPSRSVHTEILQEAEV
jgi:hypothetical protein